MADPAWWRGCDPGQLAAVDFEASCLPSYGRGFPLEVGLSCVGTGETKSWLIRPDGAWLGWDWDPAAEAIHGISLKPLPVFVHIDASGATVFRTSTGVPIRKHP